MKRGFLNAPRYKRAIDEAYAPAAPPEPEPTRRGRSSSSSSRQQDGGDSKAITTLQTADTPQDTKPHTAAKNVKEKGKEKEEIIDDDESDSLVSSIPSRPLPRRPGWGRNPEEDFFHVVPPSHGGRFKKRAVFRFWPRDPKGNPLLPTEKQRGTLSPDGYPWGATLYDFFHVNRIPGVAGLVSIMTGSAICEAMKEMGELDAAAPEIEWVESEGMPRVEGVADTGELVRGVETRMYLIGRSKSRRQDTKGGKISKMEKKQDKKDVATDSTSKDGNVDTVLNSIPPPPTIPTTSPFHPSHYPEPWPFTPFESPQLVLLQEQIPLYLLPRTLYVHDPFSLLSVGEQTFQNTSWTSRPDIIRTYNLYTSSTGPIRSQVEEARRKAEEFEEFKARTLIILRYKRTKEEMKNNEPVIEVPLPPYSRGLTMVEEGHLYLSPVARVGEGHHSVVYEAEWELPRDIFVKKSICRVCFEESAKKELQRLKDTGRYQRMLGASSWGPNGFTGREPRRAELDEVNDPPNPGSDGDSEVIEREVTCFISPSMAPSQVVEMLDANGTWDILMKNKEANSAYLQFIEVGDEKEELVVPIIRINPPFSNQKLCTHQPFICQHPVPRTAKFTVIAKLSIENDYHLAREARNYQMFPERFFNHYSGYTIINQLHSIVPVHAIVPQFYGYYTPKEENGQPPYLSPILLLEYCGKPIKPEKLSDEDQEECAGMLLRFQRAGWLHESVAPRNFLVQYGKPTEFPLIREGNPEPSFRLIDFGRSRKYETAREKQSEEMDVLKMFDGLARSMKMNVTLGP